MESKDPSTSTGTMPELNDFVSMLIVYCEQNDDTPGPAATKALGAYAEAPIGPGPALDAIHATMLLQWHLITAAALEGSYKAIRRQLEGN